MVAILGPTASGKSNTASYLAKKLDTEIISADARQLYKGMSIGTAAPRTEEQVSLRYHFVGTESPLRPLSAGEYANKCLKLLLDRFKEKNVLLLVGGSGLYVRAVCEGLSPSVDVPSNIRKKWRSKANKGCLKVLQSYVSTHDPTYYAKVDRKNIRRLARAAEVIESSGQTYSSQLTTSCEERPFRIHKVALLRSRAELYERIETRCKKMLSNGLWKEARKLYEKYEEKSLPTTIGYTELFNYFAGRCSQSTSEEQWIRNSRHYAKRQMTWLRKEDNLLWFAAEDRSSILDYLRLKGLNI